MNTSTQIPSDQLDLLDQTLEDLPDMPSIELFPNGSHKVNISFEVDKEDRSKVRIKLKYLEALELADPLEAPPAPGDTNTIFISLRKKDGTPNTFGQGTLKAVVSALAPSFPGASVGEIMNAANGAEVVVKTKIRKGTGDYKGRDSIDIVNIAVV